MSEWDAFPVAGAAAAKPATSGWDAFPAAGGSRANPDDAGDSAGPRPSGDDVSALSAARALPIVGAYSDKAAAKLRTWARGGKYEDNLKQIQTDIGDYQEKHPIASTVGDLTIGSLPYVVAGEFAGPAKLLGMTGDTLGGMAGRAAASGGAIGGADAVARGEDPIEGVVKGALTGAAGPVIGRGVGKVARFARNLVSPPPRLPNTVDLNGNTVRVPQSAIDGSPETQWMEERARKGVNGPDAQDIAAAGDEATQADTLKATRQFGDELRGGPGPAPPQATPSEAAGQTITELAQQHNDQITGQARHEAQLAAEGAGIRQDVGAALGAPEQPERSGLSYAEQSQRDLQRAERAAATTRDTRYQQVGTAGGEYTDGTWRNIGQWVRDHIGSVTGRARPVTVNPQLTANSAAMLDVLDNRLGNGYYENALRRGQMIRMPDGRVVPRPLTAADVEAARQEMNGYLQDARAVQARGGSGTDAYAAQRIMDAFDRYHTTLLSTPGTFSGDAAGYLQAIRAARQAHASYRNTFTNQRRGDNVGPSIQKITGAHNAEAANADATARLLWGSPSNPGGGNALAVGRRYQRIFGAGSPEMQNYKQGLLNHILNTPEGMEALTAAKQADRLQTYLQTPHAREFFSEAERTRLMQHAQDLRAGNAITPEATTQGQRIVQKLADGSLSEADLLKRLLLPSGEVSPSTLSTLKELKGLVSQPTWNKMRQAVWHGLNERPEGVTEWGAQALSQRISKFLGERGGQFGEAAQTMFSPRELQVMKQFVGHHEALAYKPGVFNSSNSANVGAKLAQHGVKHTMALLSAMIFGHTIPGRIAAAAAGEGVQRATQRMTNAQQVARTRELFLGKTQMPELNKNYERAAAVLGHAARPLSLGGP